MPDRTTYHRVEGAAPQLASVDLERRIGGMTGRVLWCSADELVFTEEELVAEGYSSTADGAWELARTAASEAYYAAENARLKAHERWTAICRAADESAEPNRCPATMVKGRCELDKGHDGFHRTRNGEYMWGSAAAPEQARAGGEAL